MSFLTLLRPLGVLLAAEPGTPPDTLLQATKFDIDASHSAVEFSVRFMGLSRIRGRFAEFNGTVMYVDDDISRSTVSVLINTASLDTDNDWRDRDLRENFFQADSFPTILFRSTRVEKTGQGFVATGSLTMKGVTRTVSIPFLHTHGRMKDGWENIRIGFEGELKLNRKDFGVVGAPFWNRMVDLDRMAISDSVTIELNIQASLPNFDRWGLGGGPKPSIGELVLKTIDSAGIDQAAARYRRLRQSEPEGYNFGEGQLNIVGYRLLQHGRIKEAVQVFRLNAEAHPQSSNVHDSLGEALAAAGDRANAIASYERSLALDPKNAGAMEMLRWLK
jgi:polyisoprenoid-binding protein YceI